MSSVSSMQLVSVEDYLSGELTGDVKHEYLGGVIYAMAGGRNVHNLIATNSTSLFRPRLRGGPCQPYNSDTKIRIQTRSRPKFYYPDAMVVCDGNPPNDSFQDRPVVVVEVLSRKTRRIDEGEKKDAYFTIPSLLVYLLVEQETPAVTAYRRTEEDFDREIYLGLDAVIPLPEIDAELPLAELYEDVEFTPEANDQDES